MIANTMRNGSAAVNRVDETNKHAQSTDYSKMNKRTSSGLDDVKKVHQTEKKQSGRDLDGILKDEARKAVRREHLEKMLSIGAAGRSVQVKTQAKIMTDHPEHKNSADKDCQICECETCKNRRYQDQSGDSAVSFQQATAMKPEEAVHRVKAHEMEHVRREQYKANAEGNKIVSQSVQIMTQTCEECGKMYVSGGLTRTYTRYQDSDYMDLFKVGAEDMFKKGNAFAATG